MDARPLPLAEREVFGFLPYWELPRASSADFEVLTTLAWFGVEAGRDGRLDEVALEPGQVALVGGLDSGHGLPADPQPLRGAHRLGRLATTLRHERRRVEAAEAAQGRLAKRGSRRRRKHRQVREVGPRVGDPASQVRFAVLQQARAACHHDVCHGPRIRGGVRVVRQIAQQRLRHPEELALGRRRHDHDALPHDGLRCVDVGTPGGGERRWRVPHLRESVGSIDKGRGVAEVAGVRLLG